MNTMFSNTRCGRNALTAVAFLALNVFSAKPGSIFDIREQAAQRHDKFSNAPEFIEAREKIKKILHEAITNMEDQIHDERTKGLLKSEKDVSKRWLELLNDNEYGPLRDNHYSLIYKKFNTGELTPECIADEFLQPLLVRSHRPSELKEPISRQGSDDEANHPQSDHEIRKKLRRVKRQKRQFRDRKIQKQRKAIFKEFRKTFISRLESASAYQSRTTARSGMVKYRGMWDVQKMRTKSDKKQKKKERYEEFIMQHKTHSGSFVPTRGPSGDMYGDCYEIDYQTNYKHIVGLPKDDIIHLQYAEQERLKKVGRIPPPSTDLPSEPPVTACRAKPDEILLPFDTECSGDDDDVRSNSTTTAKRKRTPEEIRKMRDRRRNRDAKQFHRSEATTALEIELLRGLSGGDSGNNTSEPRKRMGSKKTESELRQKYGKPAAAAEGTPTI